MHIAAIIAILLGAAFALLLLRGSALRKGVILMALLVVFLLAGVIPARGGGQGVVFHTPVFAALVTALCGTILWSVFRMPFRWRKLGFFLVHLGVPVIVCGAFAGFLGERKTQFAAPLAVGHEIQELPGPDDTNIPLGFGIAVKDFDVEFHPPVYGLYKREGVADGGALGEYQLVREVRVEGEEPLELGDGRVVRISQLCDDDGHWARQYILDDGNLLQITQQTPKHYRATMTISDKGDPAQDFALAVNHPVSHRGWRFYLMSYDQKERRYVVISARNDPGRAMVIAGIWLLILGTAWMCWQPHGETHASA
ncbi:MAG: cytochrome c biogenesis protein ResB [Lentisphaeria bacterium]|nr:cytochrome c biogenesis protein ResB [Lentisphaeria bacterium]